MAKPNSSDSLSKGWHPNFRDAATLPDIKVVRTGFFLSAVSITLALVCALFVGYREYQIHTLTDNTSKLALDIASQKSKHTAIVQANAKFISQVKRVEELDSFLSGQLIASAFIMDLGRHLDPRMALQTLTVRDETATIEGSIAASAEASPAILEAYKTTLARENVGQSIFDNIEMKSLQRNSDLNLMQFTMILERKPVAEAAGKNQAKGAKGHE